jgi:molybdopterin-guanine dinucleotide biosynthesis protein
LEIIMELIYTAQASGFEPGKRYRNPQHFDRPEPGVKAVVIVGDWPKVADAYEDAGAEVTFVEAPKRVALVEGPDQAELDRLTAELASVGVIVESFAAQSLERPEGELGETAGRLFQVLEAVNAGVASLQRERDGEVQKVAGLEQEKAELLKHIESLKAASADPEVEALKVKLDQAGVTYRANASKESLQKLVDELDKK